MMPTSAHSMMALLLLLLLCTIIKAELNYQVNSVFKQDGELYTFGSNVLALMPLDYVRKLSLHDNMKHVNVSDFCTCESGTNYALARNGSLFFWGKTLYLSSAYPMHVRTGVSKILSCSDYAAAFLLSNGAFAIMGKTFLNAVDPVTLSTYTVPTVMATPGGLQVRIAQLFARSGVMINTNNEMWVFGYNNVYQLGTGTTDTIIVWTRVTLAATPQDVKCSNNFCILLATDNRVFAWGDNTYGQLGFNTSTTIPVYTGINNVAQIEVGRYFAFAKSLNGTVMSWGLNSYGQLGIGSSLFKHESANIVSFPSSISKIFLSPSSLNTFVVSSANELYACGINEFNTLLTGQLSNPARSFFVTSASIQVNETITAIQAAPSYAYVLTDVGNLYFVGKLEDSINGYQVPVEWVQAKQLDRASFFGNESVSFISYGIQSAVVITSSGKIYGYGAGMDPVSFGLSFSPYIPTRLGGVLSDNVIVWAAYSGVYTPLGAALTNRNELVLWGNSLFLNQTSSQIVAPRIVSFNGIGSTFRRLCIGGYHAVAVTHSGTVYVWTTGSISSVNLVGDGSTSTPTAPVRLNTINGVVQVRCGLRFSLAITSGGSLYGWGENEVGQIGQGSTSVSVLFPALINIQNISEASAGSNFAMALTRTGAVYAWGANTYGQIGDGSTIDKYSPTLIPASRFGNEKVVSIGATRYFCNAVTESGRMYGWGLAMYSTMGPDLQNMVQLPSLLPILNVSRLWSTYQTTLILEGDPVCFGVSRTNTSVCSSHGVCTKMDTCVCDIGYSSSNCSVTTCFGQLSTNMAVCNGQGSCSTTNNCTCNVGWMGGNCTGHGTCSAGSCICSSGWSGGNCDIFTCHLINGAVCSGHGQCTGPNLCQCTAGYSGANCDAFYCFDTLMNSSTVCSSNGNCTQSNICSCSSNFTGNICSIPICFSIYANDSSVCNGYGTCDGPNSCSCNANYTGKNCSVPICYTFPATSQQSCSGHGSCVTPNTCQCTSNYTSANCSIPFCYSISASNTTFACSGNGVCEAPNHCSCNANYSGVNCNFPICYSIPSWNLTSCSGHGNCLAPNTCGCSINYTGFNCSIPICYSISALSPSVCSNHGACIAPQVCNCTTNYSGAQCEQFYCFGAERNSSNVCNGHGRCIDNNFCTCSANYTGSNCSIPVCFSISAHLVSVCSGRGACVSPNLCVCSNAFMVGGDECSIPRCNSILATNSSVCSSHGVCSTPNNCICNPSYTGIDCSIPLCFNISASNSAACSSHGSCSAPDNCLCNTGYSGHQCNITLSCFSLVFSNSTVCSGHGHCISTDNCLCNSNFSGPQCQNPQCFNTSATSINVCSGHGACVAPNSCYCNLGYSGPYCSATVPSSCVVQINIGQQNYFEITRGKQFSLSALYDCDCSPCNVTSISWTWSNITLSASSLLTVPAFFWQAGKNYSILFTVATSVTVVAKTLIIFVKSEPPLVTLSSYYAKASASNPIIIEAKVKEPSKTSTEISSLVGTWTCTRNGAACSFSWNSFVSGYSIYIPSNTMTPGTYQFALDVLNSQTNQSVSAVCAIEIESSTNVLFMRVDVIGSFGAVNPQKRVVVKCSYMDNAVFTWSVVHKTSNGTIWSQVGPSTVLIIPENVLLNSQGYTINLVARNASNYGEALIPISTLSPPANGSLSVLPTSGVSMSTIFSFNTSGWVSTAPITYTLGILTNDSFSSEFILFQGAGLLFSSVLPAGALSVFVRAIDDNGLIATSTIRVPVTSNDNTIAIATNLRNTVANSNMDTNTLIAYIVAAVSSVPSADVTKPNVSVAAVNALASNIDALVSTPQFLSTNQVISRTLGSLEIENRDYMESVVTIMNITFNYLKQLQSEVGTQESQLLYNTAENLNRIVELALAANGSTSLLMSQVETMLDQFALATHKSLQSNNEFGETTTKLMYQFDTLRTVIVLAQAASNVIATSNVTIACNTGLDLTIRVAEYTRNVYSFVVAPANFTLVSSIASIKVLNSSSSTSQATLTFTISKSVANASCFTLMNQLWKSSFCSTVQTPTVVSCSCRNTGTAVAVFETIPEIPVPITSPATTPPIWIIVLSIIAAIVIACVMVLYCILVTCTLFFQCRKHIWPQQTKIAFEMHDAATINP